MKALDIMRRIRNCGPGITPTERLVLMALVLRVDSKTLRCGKYAPALPTLADDTALHRRTVMRALVNLEGNHIITIYRGGKGRQNDYQIHPQQLSHHQRLTLVSSGTESPSGGTESLGVVTLSTPSSGTESPYLHSAYIYNKDQPQQGDASGSKTEPATQEIPDGELLFLMLDGGINKIDKRYKSKAKAIKPEQLPALLTQAAYQRTMALCKAKTTPPVDDQGTRLWWLHEDRHINTIMERALAASGGYDKAHNGGLIFIEYWKQLKEAR